MSLTFMSGLEKHMVIFQDLFEMCNLHSEDLYNYFFMGLPDTY